MTMRLKTWIAAAMVGMMAPGVIAGPLYGPATPAARAAEVHTYVYEVWAFDLLRTPSDFGHHRVSFVAQDDQQASYHLKVYLLSWGQRLRDQDQHYNSLRSRFVSKW